MLTEPVFLPLPLDGCRAVTSFRGGAGVYGGFNACHYTGDAPEHVAMCRNVLAGYFGVDVANLVIPHQTHSANVAVVTESVTELDDVDGIVTSVPGLVLCINTADCVPVLLCDAVHGVIAAVHSGWRGTVARIVARAVDAMVAIGADRNYIRAVMGPSICNGCFEVGEEVAAQFDAEFGGKDGIVIRGGKKPHVDLGKAIAATLEGAGVSTDAVTLPVACSHCDGSPFFSARREGVLSGRTLTAVMLGGVGFRSERS